MRCNKGGLFIGALASCLVVATLVLMMVASPRPAHADEAEELFKACTDYIGGDADKARQVLNSCNRLIERYSGDLSRDKLGKVYDRRGGAKAHFEQYTSAISDHRRAIEVGERSGYYLLGNYYMVGIGVPQDQRRAKELFKKGCDLNDTPSCGALEMFK